MCPSRSGRSATIPVAYRRDGAGPIVAVHDRVGPLAVEVDVVAGRVEVPGADAGRAAADLGEPQPLRPEEPLHVRGATCRCPSASLTRCAHLAQLAVVRRRVDPVGRDELRRDPPGPHRVEHVRVVVRDEVDATAPVDRRACRRSPRGPRRTPRPRSTPTPWPPNDAERRVELGCGCRPGSCPARRRPLRGLRISG